jgi:hypothetical protein
MRTQHTHLISQNLNPVSFCATAQMAPLHLLLLLLPGSLLIQPLQSAPALVW